VIKKCKAFVCTNRKIVVNWKLNHSVPLGVFQAGLDVGNIVVFWMEKIKPVVDKNFGNRGGIGLTMRMPIGNWTIDFVTPNQKT
jgi:hypothetical protein